MRQFLSPAAAGERLRRTASRIRQMDAELQPIRVVGVGGRTSRVYDSFFVDLELARREQRGSR